MPSPDELRAYDLLAAHVHLSELASLTRTMLVSAWEARRTPVTDPAEVRDEALAERRLDASSLETELGRVDRVLGEGPSNDGERSLAVALAAHAVAEPGDGREDDEERPVTLAARLLWLAANGPFDATPLLDRALGDEATPIWRAIGARVRVLASNRDASPAEAAVGVRALESSASETARRTLDELRDPIRPSLAAFVEASLARSSAAERPSAEGVASRPSRTPPEHGRRASSRGMRAAERPSASMQGAAPAERSSPAPRRSSTRHPAAEPLPESLSGGSTTGPEPVTERGSARAVALSEESRASSSDAGVEPPGATSPARVRQAEPLAEPTARTSTRTRGVHSMRDERPSSSSRTPSRSPFPGASRGPAPMAERHPSARARAATDLLLEGELGIAPRGPAATTLFAITGVLLVMRAAWTIGHVALAYRRPAEVSFLPSGVRVRARTEMLGRTLREQEILIPREALMRATREVLYPRIAFYAGLFSLALGSYVGVSLLVDGGRAASPSLLLTGFLVVAGGIVLDVVLGSIGPGKGGRCRVLLVPSKGAPLCLEQVDAKRADEALARFASL